MIIINKQKINKLMESEQQTIISLIHEMKTERVSEAEDKLMSMVTNIEFMNKIFNIIKNKSLQPWVKTIASSFLNKVISEKLQQYGYKTMFLAISSIMMSYDVLPSDKRCFERSIVSLIEYIKEPEEIEEWRQFILKHVTDPLLLDTGLLLIGCTSIAEIQTDYLCIIVEDTFDLTLTSVNVSIQNAMVINELVKCWIVVLDKLKSMSEEESVSLLLVKMCTSRNLAKLIWNILQFNNPSQILLCVNPQLRELNLLKYQASELNRKVSEYSLANKIPIDQCHCLKLIFESYKKIKNSIVIVAASPNLEIIQLCECEDFITSLLGLLIVYVKAAKEHSFQEMQILQHLMCCPFLKTREQQMYMFEQSPEEFNTLAEDLCDKQTYGILKTQAARLLQVISDYNKDALERSIQYCVQCIKINIGYIPKFENSDVRVLDLETCFQILAIYSFGLQNYQTHLDSLKVILCDTRMMDLPALQLSKIFLFLAYNYEQIFKNPTEGGFWVDFALQYQAHPTTRYMALDFISNIADEYFTEDFFKKISSLVVQCQSRESGMVWNIVTKLFETQKQKITEQNCLILVNTVFSRIQKQFEMLQSGMKQYTQDIINSIHILRKIVESKEYIQSKQALKMRILDITVIYQKAINLDLEDQIIKILIQYMKFNQQTVREKIFVLLPQILDQFKKDEYYQNSYFILLNEIIVKSKFLSVLPIIKTLLSGLMFHLFDMSENAKKRKMKIAIANILTLLQNLLSIHGYEMAGSLNDCLCQIGAMCIRLFPSKEGEKIFSKTLLAKALNLMFICHLYSKTQNTVEYLIKYGRQNIFLKYDAFVLVKLLSKALFSQENIQIVIEYLNLMIDVTNEEEKNEKKVKTAKGKMKIKRQEQLNDLVFYITSPFIQFDYNKSNRKLPIKKQVVECIQKMKSHNLQTYKLIVLNMNEVQKVRLTDILKQTAQIQGTNRVIRKVVGVKIKKEELSQEINENSDAEDNADSSNFKRYRVLKKKNQDKKRKGDKINAE